MSTSTEVLPRLGGKVALVTGASSGIGLAIAERLKEEGARVVTAQRSDASGFESVTADLSDAEVPACLIETVVSMTGSLDILVNNAGLMREATAIDCAYQDWQATLALNLTAPFLLIRHALPHLAGGGAIINIGSIEGIAANPRHPAYSASKGGLHALTRAIAVDHGRDGIRCNAVAPGWIDTPLNEDFIAAMPDPERFRARLAAIHPLDRTGHAQEVAALVAFLASDDAAFITGQVHVIDGGRLARPSLPSLE